MKKITLIENCFGPDVVIDDESLFMHEYDNRSPEIINSLQDSLIDELKSLKSKIGMNDWYQIAELVTRISDVYEYDVENSIDSESCDQCGNWNHNHVFNKKEI